MMPKTQFEKQMNELYGFKLIEQGFYTRFKNFETKEEIFIDTDLKIFTHNINSKRDKNNIENYLMLKGFEKSLYMQ